MEMEETKRISVDDAIKEGLEILANDYAAFDGWLRSYFSYEVPEIFSSLENNSYDEDKANSHLFEVITRLICGDFAPNFAHLAEKFRSKEISSSKQICGRVFRNGEATYTCRTCATDATCVLCYDCFSNSPHKSHKYRTSASGGTGYCDCGDVEAWKSHPFCDNHKNIDAGKSEDAQTMKFDQTPVDLLDRARVVLRSVLKYALQLLCWEYSDILPKDLRLRLIGQPYHTVLFNDESHSYDDVIISLTRALACTEDRATFLASVVDREGRTTVRTGQLDQCDRARVEIKQLSTIGGTKAPLIVETMNSCLIAHQQFAHKLLYWLISAVQKFDPLLRIATEIFMNETLDCGADPDPCSMMLTVLRRDSRLWKGARVNIHKFIMGTVLLNLETKKQFSLVFMQNYPSLIMDYIEDDHEYSLSIVSLTVQIFTVPTIARLLIGTENALVVIFDCVIRVAESYISGPNKRLNFQSTSLHVNFRRALLCLSEIEYLLTVPPKKSEDWSVDLRNNFLLGFDKFLTLLGFMQYMNETQRKHGDHEEFESEWEMAFNIQLKVCPILALVQKWAASDLIVCQACFEKVYEKCVEFHKTASVNKETLTVEGFGIRVQPVNFSVSKEVVSIHIPLQRLLAGLCLILIEKQSAPTASIDWQNFYEYPLRIFVLCAQVQCGLWRRNGLALPNQLQNYVAPYCRSEMFDKDLLLMQIGAATTEANEFIVTLLHKFHILKWITGLSDSSNSFSDDSNKVLACLFDEFLQLLISIFAERYAAGVGTGVGHRDTLRYVVVQLLSRGPMPFSKLERSMSSFHADYECPSLDEIVRSVADFRPPAFGSAGVFVLKAECWPDYATFFYLHSKHNMTEAEELQLKERKNADLAIRARQPPVPPPFTPFFTPIVQLLVSDAFLQICSQLLKKACDESPFCTESHLHRVLYLVNLALNEQQAHANKDVKDDFALIATSEKFDLLNILTLLRRSLSPTNRYFALTDLIIHTINRFVACSNVLPH